MESPKIKRLRSKVKDAEHAARMARTAITHANDVVRRKQNEASSLNRLIIKMVLFFICLLFIR